MNLENTVKKFAFENSGLAKSKIRKSDIEKIFGSKIAEKLSGLRDRIEIETGEQNVLRNQRYNVATDPLTKPLINRIRDIFFAAANDCLPHPDGVGLSDTDTVGGHPFRPDSAVVDTDDTAGIDKPTLAT